MNKNYEIKDILSAIDLLLNQKDNKSVNISAKKEINTLVLKNEVKKFDKSSNDIPKDTEKIISEAEKYLKK
tara:strand:- start:12 stop:224 length:213 start_codon:yes stop_codon:yes gene_type:complete